MRGLAVLGATGTIGRNTLDVARRHADKLRITGLSAARDVEALAALCAEFRPPLAAMAEPAAAAKLEQKLKGQSIACRVLAGAEGIAELAHDPEAALVMSAIVGAAGLLPTLAAVRAGKRVLIANKEPLVMAGALLTAEAAQHGAELVPIDSEHNAIFQCLGTGGAPLRGDARVAKLILTASGGPFRELPLEQIAHVTPEQAVRHPNWVMGPKISVDCATMLNKGLELIEAHVLFGMADDRLHVVLHPESVIHSLVEFVDGSTLAQLGRPDMRIPIAHALAAPERWASGVEGLDFTALGPLRFSVPEARRYPGLALARGALRAGGTAPNVLNAANEIAVEAFLGKRIGFAQIATVIESTLEASAGANLPAGGTLEEILAVDAWSRAEAARHLQPAPRRASHA